MSYWAVDFKVVEKREKEEERQSQYLALGGKSTLSLVERASCVCLCVDVCCFLVLTLREEEEEEEEDGGDEDVWEKKNDDGQTCPVYRGALQAQ